jgi:hypothetical protein
MVSQHLRGFDMTMVETGYRYAELYWAGADRNWGYAEYQLDKIRQTVELGIQRRPKRAASARLFLDTAVPALQRALDGKDPAAWDRQFTFFTAACNVCHAMEQVPFIAVHPPEQRLSTVKFNP